MNFKHVSNRGKAKVTIFDVLTLKVKTATIKSQWEKEKWEGKGPCAIVPLSWKMAHQSLCRMIRNGPLKISKSLKKAENGPLAKISSQSLFKNLTF